MFFGHFPELMVVMIAALAIFGPKRFPEIGSSLGKGIRAFRTATTEMQDAVTGAPQHGRLAEQSDNGAAAPTPPAVSAPAQPAYES